MSMSEMITLLGEEKKINGVWHTKIQCKCGKVRFSRRHGILNGGIKSCGCLLTKGGYEKKTHGASRGNDKDHNLYTRWIGMKTRCYNLKDASYDNYGGRGIKICDEWKDSFENFRDWALDNEYSEDLSIDRIDNNGNYEPENCRWVDRKIQGMNKRNNIYITINNKTESITKWAENFGLDIHLVYLRYNKGDRGLRLFRNVINNKKWTDSEKEFLIKNSRNMNTKELSKKLNRSEVAVRKKRRELGANKASYYE